MHEARDVALRLADTSVTACSPCRHTGMAGLCATPWACAGRQSELEKGVQRERALAEAEGRARESRENEDVNRRALAQRLEEERKKVVEAIDTTFR